MQEPCSTLAGVGHFGHRFSAFCLRPFFFAFLQKRRLEAMETDEENRMVDVPEREEEDVVITLTREPEPSSDASMR